MASAARPETVSAGHGVIDTAPNADPSNNQQGSDTYDVASPTLSQGSISSPPYWKHVTGHQRNLSNISTDSFVHSGAITLRDNETSEHSDRNNACWAKSVEVKDHTIVNGSATNIGAFVVWIIRVETLSVSIDPAQFLLLQLDMFQPISAKLTIYRGAT
jgi:hypothetical protein